MPCRPVAATGVRYPIAGFRAGGGRGRHAAIRAATSNPCSDGPKFALVSRSGASASGDIPLLDRYTGSVPDLARAAKDHRCRSIARSQWPVVMVSARLSSGRARDDELRSTIQRLCGFDLPSMLGSPPLGSKGMTGPPQPVQIEAPSLFMRSSRLRSASLLFLARSSIFAGSNLTLEAAPSTDRSVERPEPIPAPAGRAPALDQVPERTVAQISVASNTTALFWRFIERPSKKSLYHILT